MSIEEETGVLAYSLCGCSVAGIMLNLIMLVWHCIKFKVDKYSRMIKLAFAFLYVANMVTGIAITILILYKDLKSAPLCQVGGFLVMFSTQESLWVIAACCISLLLWKQARLPWRYYKTKFQGTRRKVVVFLVIAIIQCVFLAILSMLPLTNLQYFHSTIGYYYLCVPLRMFGEEGWEYSTAILVLNWIAMATSVATLIAAIIVAFKQKGYPTKEQPWELSVYRGKRVLTSRCFTLRMVLSLCFNVLCWFIILVLASLSFFDRDQRDTSQSGWILAFSLSITILLHPLVTLGLTLLGKSECCGKGDPAPEEDEEVKTMLTKPPSKLHSVYKLPAVNQENYVSRYLAEWYDNGAGGMQCGVIKVFHPCCVYKWRNEIRAVSNLSEEEHPNIAGYLWNSPRNNLSTSICTFTGDVWSPQSSMICRMHYPHGTLQQFLKSRIQQLTEVGLHKITLDVANGLDFLHQHSLVHNGLSAETIYMAAVSESTGLKVVIGDFENSYEVLNSGDGVSFEKLRLKHTSTPISLYSISSQLTSSSLLETNQFAPDIRSFGLVVLEMLVSMSEHNHKKTLKAMKDNRRSRSLDELLNAVQSANHKTSCVQKRDVRCSCSSKVTNVRARADKSRDICDNHTAAQNRQFLYLKTQNPEAVCSNSNIASEQCEQSVVCDQAQSEDERSACPMRDETGSIITTFKNPSSTSTPVRKLPPVPPKKTRRKDSVIVKAESPVTDAADSDYGFSRLPPRRTNKGCNTDDLPLQVTPSRRRKLISTQSNDTAVNHQETKYSSPEYFHEQSVDEDTLVASPDGGIEAKWPENSPGDDHYNASIGSMGSFETIYEDEETPTSIHSSHTDPVPNGRKNHKAPVVKRKAHTLTNGRDTNHTGSVPYRAKRLSMSSFDGSITSADSGIGSSHYDLCLDRAAGIPNQPGSRTAIYASSPTSPESESYKLYRQLVSRNNPLFRIVPDSSTDSAVPDISDEVKNCRPRVLNPELNRKVAAVSGGAIHSEHPHNVAVEDSFEKLPDLKLRKQPCVKSHAHVTCLSTADGFMPSRDSDMAREIPPLPDMVQDASPKFRIGHLSSNGSYPEEEDPVYEKISPRDSNKIGNHRQTTDTGVNTDSKYFLELKPESEIDTNPGKVKKSNSKRTQNSESENKDIVKTVCTCQCAAQPLSPDSLHPMFSRQYKRITNPMPKLGVSAVTARRNSDVSSVASSQSRPSTALSLDSAYPSYNGHSQGSRTPRCGELAPVNSRVTRGSYHRSTSAQSHTPNGLKTDLLHPGLYANLSPSPASVSSSIWSLLQDSKYILRNYKGDSPEKSRDLTKTVHGVKSTSSNDQPDCDTNRSGLGQTQMQYCHKLAKHHPLVQHGTLMSASQRKLQKMLDSVRNEGKLGFTAGQLLPLLKDCWLEEPVPSAEEILKRLAHLLPSAVV